MAKKARRKKHTVLTQAQLEGTKQKETVTTNKVVIEVHHPEPDAKTELDLRTEYRYVVADLRRIGILAALMLMALVVLNLFLR